MLVGDVLSDVSIQVCQLELAAAFDSTPVSGVVDDEPAHHLARILHETRPIWKRGAVPAGHLEVGFVQERRRAQVDAEPTSRELTAGQPMQLGVQGGKQNPGGGFVAVLGVVDEHRNRRFQRWLPTPCSVGTKPASRILPKESRFSTGW